MKRRPPINDLLAIMAKLRAPDGCPWDRQQDHRSIRWHAVEEVYELIDAIENDDDLEMMEELGDLLLQVVFHCQLARERGVFDFDQACRHVAEKLVRRHPHVFAQADAKTVEAVWTQWEKIKKAEKEGTPHERPSALDGIPKHLPALLRAEKLVKKARRAGLWDPPEATDSATLSRTEVAQQLFGLASHALAKGWSAEELLCREVKKHERRLRRSESAQRKKPSRKLKQQ